jgi:hypothetical protein
MVCRPGDRCRNSGKQVTISDNKGLCCSYLFNSMRQRRRGCDGSRHHSENLELILYGM